MSVNISARISVFVPVKLVSELNMREHWRVRWRRRTQQSQAVLYALAFGASRPCWMDTMMTGTGCTPVPGKAWREPLTITLTRDGGNKLDSDNLASCFKAVRDGIARYYGVDDGDETKLTFAYKQRPGGRCRGCEITIEAREAA
jgi:hypothetical protein